MLIYGAFLLIPILIGILFLIRNAQVFQFRLRLINRIHRLNQQDIHENRIDFRGRYIKFDTMSYEAMLFKFWIPLIPEYWYKDTSFLE